MRGPRPDSARQRRACAARRHVLAIAAVAAGVCCASARAASLVSFRGRDAPGLRALLAAQDDPASPQYHRWLTPSDFGRRFGAAAHDVRRVSRWLRDAGCPVQRLAGRLLAVCRARLVPSVPSSLRGVVTDVIDLERPVPLTGPRPPGSLAPMLSVDSRFVLAPADFARIYNLETVKAAGADGRGQTIGILAISRIDPADLALFRTTFGLPAADLVQDGGTRVGGIYEAEAILDASWAGAVAPGARLVLAVSSSSPVAALARLVNRADVSVISSSIDVCGRGRLARQQSRIAYRLFRQARAQGQSILIASGDMGPKSCGRLGGLARFTSSPLVTAVGGTTPSPTLDAQGNATGYGTEVVWNENGAASGGGMTSLPRPAYQRGRAQRTVPDVAFPASEIYPIGFQGQMLCCVGGTSAATPVWAGVIALLDQLDGRRAGFLNPRLYALGRAQTHGGPPVYHDVTEGSNAVPSARGFQARRGYDLATGWGTIDGAAFLRSFGAP